MRCLRNECQFEKLIELSQDRDYFRFFVNCMLMRMRTFLHMGKRRHGQFVRDHGEILS